MKLFQLTSKSFRRIALTLASLSWGILLFAGLIEQYRYELHIQNQNFSPVFKGTFLNIFIIGIYIYFWQKTREKRHVVLHDMIWQVFLTALVCTLFSGILSLLSNVFHSTPNNDHLIKIFTFYIEFALLITLLFSAFVIWKRMILYEKSEFAFFSWYGFEYALFSAIVLHFFEIDSLEVIFTPLIGFFFIWIMVISVNLKWVPHLVFSQKITSVFQLVVILFCLAYFYASLSSYQENESLILGDYGQNIFFSGLFLFIITYSFTSLLVIIFNLPTSSVFEKKIKELSIFHKLSDTIIEGENVEALYQILLDSTHNTVAADASWLQTNESKDFKCINFSDRKALEIKKLIYNSGYDGKKTKIIGKRNFFTSPNHQEYKSILAVPIKSGEQNLGTMVLMKHINNAFDNSMVEMVNTFVAQAGIAIHNFNLISQAVENERYKGELEIAKRVHSRLLPKEQWVNENFEIFAISESATEVGGDYYDFFKISEEDFVIIIADVAGKGISAAFNMAQMKGIFQALVRSNLNASEFLVKANAALSDCLEKSAFITASYYHINTRTKKITFSRAGHCPTLFYKSDEDKVKYLETGGLGLGIVRNDRYENYVEINELPFQKNDLMMLFTDGIVETMNNETSEQYGYDRLHKHFESHKKLPLKKIGKSLIEELISFKNDTNIDDDYTVLIIKF
ncbi:GAF domain-containing SpoIIE family protein phosphatase [Flexithrix dorotheae]|uniref:GAF domain-containing SpoIIE family protein phosphatase n=1 Tax=Flexithrix dorotheae TaxID=70993 RepID=UPI00036035A5|nr:GAF domain-containing SpoIIE family protein phosphatase [Flexithrix dorotheae]